MHLASARAVRAPRRRRDDRAVRRRAGTALEASTDAPVVRLGAGLDKPQRAAAARAQVGEWLGEWLGAQAWFEFIVMD
jgi:hypothetical protein